MSSVDMTIGLGGDTLSLPGNNSTDEIKLEDILDLGNSDFVTIADNGDYYLSKSDDSYNSSGTSIDNIYVNAQKQTSYSINIRLDSLSGKIIGSSINTENISDQLAFTGDISAFDYKYTSIPSEITKLDYATVSSEISTTIGFSESLQNSVPVISSMAVTLPKFLDVSFIVFEGIKYYPDSNNSVYFTDIHTNKQFILQFDIAGFDFDAEADGNNYLIFDEGDSISVHGDIKLSGIIDEGDVDMAQAALYDNWDITGYSNLGSMTISSATGQFKPAFTFDNLGKVELDEIPDFLSGKNVVADLWNPQININVDSNLPLDGLISGTLISKDADGNRITSVDIPEFAVKANGKSIISILKQPAADNEDTTFVVVPNLSDLIKTIPNSIEFTNIKVAGDDSKKATIEFGRTYYIHSGYSFKAPLAFDSDAKIVYRDTLDGWNDNLKDMKFAKSDGSSYLKMTADAVNKIPVNLNVEAFAIDTDKNIISHDEMEIAVSDIAGIGEQNYTESQPVTLKIVPKNDSVLKRTDGIIFIATGSSSENIKGKTVNAYNQTLVLNNMTLTKVGQFVGNFN